MIVPSPNRGLTLPVSPLPQRRCDLNPVRSSRRLRAQKFPRRSFNGGSPLLYCMNSFRIFLLVASAFLAAPSLAVANHSQIKLFSTQGEAKSNFADPHQQVDHFKGNDPKHIIWDSVGPRDTTDKASSETISARLPAVEVDVLLALAKTLNDWLATTEAAGAVISHGPSNLEETAYFLNLVLKSDKPVVVIAAMTSTSINGESSSNLYDAVRVAACPEAKGLGVVILLNNQINSARDPSHANKAEEGGSLGCTNADRITFHRRPVKRHTRGSEFDISGLNTLPRVDLIAACPLKGQTPIRAHLAAGAQGLVLTQGGSDDIEEARAKGVFLVQSKCRGACCAEQSDDVPPRGVLSSGSLNPRKARILLRLALTKTSDPKEIQRMFNEY